MECVSALKRKHQIEAEEEMLKREKEKLELETEFAATSGKLNILEINSQCGSQLSDGMHSYFEKNNSQEASKLHSNADSFVPDKVDEMVNTGAVPDHISQPQVVKPKHKCQQSK